MSFLSDDCELTSRCNHLLICTSMAIDHLLSLLEHVAVAAVKVNRSDREGLFRARARGHRAVPMGDLLCLYLATAKTLHVLQLLLGLESFSDALLLMLSLSFSFRSSSLSVPIFEPTVLDPEYTL